MAKYTITLSDDDTPGALPIKVETVVDADEAGNIIPTPATAMGATLMRILPKFADGFKKLIRTSVDPEVFHEYIGFAFALSNSAIVSQRVGDVWQSRYGDFVHDEFNPVGYGTTLGESLQNLRKANEVFEAAQPDEESDSIVDVVNQPKEEFVGIIGIHPDAENGNNRFELA